MQWLGPWHSTSVHTSMGQNTVRNRAKILAWASTLQSFAVWWHFSNSIQQGQVQLKSIALSMTSLTSWNMTSWNRIMKTSWGWALPTVRWRTSPKLLNYISRSSILMEWSGSRETNWSWGDTSSDGKKIWFSQKWHDKYERYFMILFRQHYLI